MNRIGLSAAWALSVLSLWIPLPVEHEAGGVLSRTMLCALPWLMAVGLPRRACARVAERRWWSVFAGIAPPLLLALALDYSIGFAPETLFRYAACLAFAFCMLALASSITRQPGYALVWLLLVPLPPALTCLPDWGSSGHASFEAFARATPLGWATQHLVHYRTADLSADASNLVLGAWREHLGLFASSGLLLLAAGWSRSVRTVS